MSRFGPTTRFPSKMALICSTPSVYLADLNNYLEKMWAERRSQGYKNHTRYKVYPNFCSWLPRLIPISVDNETITKASMSELFKVYGDGHSISSAFRQMSDEPEDC